MEIVAGKWLIVPTKIVRSRDGTRPRFVVTNESVPVRPDGTFATTFDFGDQQAGDAVEVTVRSETLETTSETTLAAAPATATETTTANETAVNTTVAETSVTATTERSQTETGTTPNATTASSTTQSQPEEPLTGDVGLAALGLLVLLVALVFWRG